MKGAAGTGDQDGKQNRNYLWHRSPALGPISAAPANRPTPPVGRCLRPGRPTGRPVAQGRVFAYLGQKVATCANVSESKHFHERARRVCLPSHDYFKDSSCRAFPPALWANYRIVMSRRVRFLPYDNRSIPPVTANGTRRRPDGLL